MEETQHIITIVKQTQYTYNLSMTCAEKTKNIT